MSVFLSKLFCTLVIYFNTFMCFRIVCRTGVNLSGPMPAAVVVGNRAGVTRAQEQFHYKVQSYF